MDLFWLRREGKASEQNKPKAQPLTPEVGSFAVVNALEDSELAHVGNPAVALSTPKDAQAAQRVVDAQFEREKAAVTRYFG